MINEELIKTYLEFKKKCLLKGIIDVKEILWLFEKKLEVELK